MQELHELLGDQQGARGSVMRKPRDKSISRQLDWQRDKVENLAVKLQSIHLPIKHYKCEWWDLTSEARRGWRRKSRNLWFYNPRIARMTLSE